jgi:hypothetical protein
MTTETSTEDVLSPALEKFIAAIQDAMDSLTLSEILSLTVPLTILCAEKTAAWGGYDHTADIKISANDAGRSLTIHAL